ncbi:DUF2933 domain-containing protein [Phenylobacterium sp.]|uniref:DUF2933 domain-containing protein n=1 Tax=Phenylobacterium sp. TaxID=1871053 RepID=UPI0035C8554A
MAWLSQNWIWLLAGAAFIGLHLFGHGAHGGHRHRRGPANDGPDGSHGAAPPVAQSRPPLDHPPH